MMWTRYVKGGRFREVAEVGGALVVRTGEGQVDAKTDRVEQDLAGYLKKLKRSGWKEYNVIEHPMPFTPSEATKARAKQAWGEPFAPLRRAYREEFARAKVRFDATFAAQTRGDEDPNALAAHCLEIAEAAFHLEFTRAASAKKSTARAAGRFRKRSLRAFTSRPSACRRSPKSASRESSARTTGVSRKTVSLVTSPPRAPGVNGSAKTNDGPASRDVASTPRPPPTRDSVKRVAKS